MKASVWLALPILWMLLETTYIAALESPAAEEWDTLLAQISIENVVGHVERLTGFGTRYVAMEGCNESARYLYKYFASLQAYEVSLHHFNVNGATGEGDLIGINVIARKKDGGRGGERVVLCAHYDSIAEGDPTFASGANDNAAAVAVLLEVARVMSAYELNRTLLFAMFSAEELGLVGSTSWVEENAETLTHSVTICLDGVGRGQLISIMYMTDASEALTEHLAEIATTLGYCHFLPMPVAAIGSDSEAFERRGFKAARLWDRDTEYIHTKLDTLDTLNIDRLEEVANLTLVACYTLSNEPLRDVFHETSPSLEAPREEAIPWLCVVALLVVVTTGAIGMRRLKCDSGLCYFKRACYRNSFSNSLITLVR